MFVTSVQVAYDFVMLIRWQSVQLLVKINQAVIHVDAKFVKQFAVFSKCFFIENAHSVAKDDGVRHLHHGGLDVQGEHHAGFAGIFELLFVEIAQSFFAHVHAVDDFACLQFGQRLEHNGFAALGDKVHLDFARFVERHRFFAMVEIAVFHVRDVAARSHAPLAHAVGAFARVVFNGSWCATVRVALAQDGVHCAT